VAQQLVWKPNPLQERREKIVEKQNLFSKKKKLSIHLKLNFTSKFIFLLNIYLLSFLVERKPHSKKRRRLGKSVT